MPGGKPLIGVVADVDARGKHVRQATQEKYLDAVTAGAGGIAVIVPARIERPVAAFTDAADLEQLAGTLDGLFLSGAVSNVLPEHYGATATLADSPADPARDAVSLQLARLAVARGVPVLGVCRGFQEINVALGGTLHQEVHGVAGLDDHREDASLDLAAQYGPRHPVLFTAGGKLQAWTGMVQARVNSLHGQGVQALAPGLSVEAVAPDGLVEAFHGAHAAFLLGVQWHPEWNFREDAVSLAILRAFGAAAAAYRAMRVERAHAPG